MKEKAIAYKLAWDRSHLTDIDYDAESYTIEETAFTKELDDIDPDRYDFPEDIFFLANFEEIPDIDYPVNTLRWPIMSKRMLSILKDCGGFLHREIPVIMIDFRNNPKDIFDQNGKIKPEVRVSTDYVAIQLLEYSDYFDYNNSLYDKDVMFGKEIVSYVNRAFFKKIQGGLAPIFRLPFLTFHLFISAEAKEALEVAGIKGVSFEPTENL